MTAGDEPTLGEVMRRLESVAGSMTTLASKIDDDRRAAADTFVRKDVHSLGNQNMDTRIKQLETDQDDRDKAAAAFRRQILVGIMGIAITAIGGLLLATSNFLAAAGR